MKNLIYFILIVAVGYWIYSKCSGDSDKDTGVMKQVKVTAKTANLRTGPATSFDIAVDHDSIKRQVKQGAVLRVVAEKDGWYEVRVDDDSCTAFIKQSLCIDLNAKGKQTKSAGRKSGTKSNAPSSTPKQKTPAPASAPAESSDGVVEEVAGGHNDDEVLY